MLVSVGFVFWLELAVSWVLRASTLGPKRWTGIRGGWFTAKRAAALLCACILSGSAKAQEAASPAASSQQKTGSAKTVNTKPQTKGASASAAKTTGSHKPHPAPGQHSKSNATVAARASKTGRVSSRKAGKKLAKARGQQKIEPERAQAIQEALIREHYLSGEAAGSWNQASEDAMRKYQADHGWQSKTVPDARALISLGLGPNHDHLLNPESAMTTGPETLHAASASSAANPVSHSADPGAPMNANQASPIPSQPPAPSAGTSDHVATDPQR
jgi:hypothetical protein